MRIYPTGLLVAACIAFLAGCGRSEEQTTAAKAPGAGPAPITEDKTAPKISEELSRRISELVKELGDPDWQKREAAEKTLEDIGEPAEPFLNAALQNTDPTIRLAAEAILPVIEVRKRVRFTDDFLKIAPNIYRDLVRMDNDWKYRMFCQAVNMRKTQDVVSLIGEICRDGARGLDPKRKRMLIFSSMVHEHVFPESAAPPPKPIPEAAPHIARLINDEDSEIRIMAVEYLGELGNKQVCPELRKLLDNRGSVIRYYAVFSLAKLGEKDMLPEVMNILNNKAVASDVRYSALFVLGNVLGKDAIPEVTKFLTDEGIRFGAALVLKKLGARDKIPKDLLDKIEELESVGDE